MFQRRPFFLTTTALVSAAFALSIANADVSRAAENATQERPLGILFTPLPVNVAPGITNAPLAPSENLSGQPPLGLLLTPLSDGDHAKTASPFSNSMMSKASSEVQPAPPLNTGSFASNERPLGLLMDRTTFTSTSSAESPTTQPSAIDSIAPPRFTAPKINWNQQGASNERPLGTLLLTGSYKPVETAQPQPTPTSISSPAVQSPLLLENTETPPAVPEDPSVNFSADEMGFDKENGVVTAQGNVEITYKERSLRADKVTYNRTSNIVTAEGNVVISEPTTETIYGEKVQLTGDLRDGFILNIGVILQDHSRIAGTSGTRTQGQITTMNKAVYSPCALCKTDPESPPLWQIKAVKVTHDKSAQIVEYRDAWIEFFGFPVFYTPYFRHPDPTVKRKSGFLFPSIGNSSDMGTIIQTPYFLNISPQEDATITPIFMTAEKPVLSAEYRNLLNKGSMEVSGSITGNSDDADDFSTEKGRYGVRGHIESEGRFDINQAWRWGFDGNWTTDDTYMRRYGFGGPSTLESRLFTESFKGRSYFSASTISFQGLEADDDSGQIPLVLPMVDFNYVGQKDRLGGNTNLDFNFLALTRDDGTDTRRLSARSMWQRPFAGVLGDVYNVSFGLNTDLYHVNGLAQTGNQPSYTGTSYRVTPEAAFEWRMPFAKSDGNTSQIIEPIAAFMWSPYGGNSSEIPNEDSIELEFDDTNLFRTNRFSGLDRVEGGPRIVYGLKWGAFGTDGSKTNVFVGQSWRPKKDDTYVVGSGLEDNFSDIVARMIVSPGPYLSASYRTRFATDRFSPNRNEISLNAGVPAFNVTGNYVFLDRQSNSEFAGREEINMSAKSQINRFWSSSLNATRDLEASEMRTAGMSLVYEDECVVFTSRLTRTFFEDRDVEPTDAIMFSLVLKTLGEVHTAASLAQ